MSQDSSNETEVPETEQPFVTHLMEMRDRVMRIVICVLVIFLCLFPFANDIYTLLAGPLMAHLPEGTSMIATKVISPFLTPLKLAMVSSIFIAMPFILYQLWGFVAPGLYKHERRLVTPLLISSSLLFYAGIAFAYYVVFPLVFDFMSATTPDGVAQTPDITEYLDFVLTMFFAFGIAFEVPIATVILVWTGMTTPDSLRAKRPYIIVGAFIAGMFLTPPDVISQTLLALPMWVLFELGLIFSRFYMKPEDVDNPDDDDDYQPPDDDEMEAELDRIDEGEQRTSAEQAATDDSTTMDPELEAELDELADDGSDDVVDGDERPA